MSQFSDDLTKFEVLHAVVYDEVENFKDMKKYKNGEYGSFQYPFEQRKKSLTVAPMIYKESPLFPSITGITHVLMRNSETCLDGHWFDQINFYDDLMNFIKNPL